jgi:hypothetical protein
VSELENGNHQKRQIILWILETINAYLLHCFQSCDEGDHYYLKKMLAPTHVGLKISAPVMLLVNLSPRLWHFTGLLSLPWVARRVPLVMPCDLCIVIENATFVGIGSFWQCIFVYWIIKSPVKCHKRGKIDEKTSRQWEQICETRHFVAINQYVMATIKLTKWGLQYNCQESLSKQFSRQQQSSIHEILIGSTGPGVSYKLRNVYSVSWNLLYMN